MPGVVEKLSGEGENSREGELTFIGKLLLCQMYADIVDPHMGAI
jgi:hypothetical protein